MSATVHTLPIWKKDSTAAEWLQEVAAVAMTHPEQFARIVVVYDEENGDGDVWKQRYYARNHKTNSQIVGALETCKLEVFEYMKGRRV